MPKDSEKETCYAKTIALKYLSRAPRSIKEVELKLGKKDIAENIAEKIIAYLIELGYLNDEIFAKQWAHSKIKSRLWGRNKIIHGLKQKGISDEIINETVMNLYQSPSDEIQEDKNFMTEAVELNTAKTALAKWIKGKARSLPPNAFIGGQKSEIRSQKKTKQTAFRHLRAKGFPTSIAVAAIQGYFGKRETDEDQ